MTAFTSLRLPIVLAPMAGVCTAEMASKVCQLGLIGSIGAGMMTPDAIRQTITEIKQKAPGKKFNINLFVVDEKPEFKPQELKSALKWTSDYCHSHGYTDLDLQDLLKPPYAPRFEDQFATVLELAPPIASFTFGLVSKEKIDQCHARGIEVWGTATTANEAKQWKDLGIEAIVLQGKEAGGHRGSFTTEDEPSLVPLDELYEATRRLCGDIPLIVSGGIMDGYEVSRYMSMGASAVQIGTLFMGASDSPINPTLRTALSGKLGYETELTRAFTGRWARGIQNDFSRAGRTQNALPYPVQNKLTQPLRASAVKRGDSQSVSAWAGVNVRRCRNKPISEIVDDLESEYRDSVKNSTN